MRRIELLAPAKNKECAFAAISHGADALYMGAAQFGARAAAGNSETDIAQVIKQAHQYGVQVFITINTLLQQDQVPGVISLIEHLYQMGADALIVQDPIIMQWRNHGLIPPIALHASTQMDNATLSKIKALEEAGYQRVVLARELNIQEIAQIRAATTIPFEAFVHGALCVSYSGRCYISQADCGRSANRGACAQYCRLPWSLVDARGRLIVQDKHLLSLKDMDRSSLIEDLIDAGVDSFKIEGRLKDTAYVKNVTATYRRLIDNIIKQRSATTDIVGAPPSHDPIQKASLGTCRFSFTPDPQRTFHRGQTPFQTQNGRFQQPVHQWDTPKSTGVFAGTVTRVFQDGFQLTLSPQIKALGGLHNGDGLCFIQNSGSALINAEFAGLRINRIEGDRVWVRSLAWAKAAPDILSAYPRIYRNYDYLFEQELSKDTATRLIPIDMRVHLNASETGLNLTVTQEALDGDSPVTVTVPLTAPLQPAQQPQKAHQSLYDTLYKLGGTPYIAAPTSPSASTLANANGNAPVWFVPVSQAATARRTAVALLEQAQRDQSLRQRFCAEKPASALATSTPTPDLAQPTTWCSLPDSPPDGASLMTCKYCIKNALGFCTKRTTSPPPWQEPLFLINGAKKHPLKFDCARCIMTVLAPCRS